MKAYIPHESVAVKTTNFTTANENPHNLAMLQKNDTVAIVAPAGPIHRQAFEKGLAIIASRYCPVFTERLFESWRYLAGYDDARALELQKALDDDNIAAMFMARGGYGSMRVLPLLRLGQKKPFIGFSDATALHLAMQAQGWNTIHAPVLTQLGNQPTEVITRLFDLLEGRPVASLHGTQTVVHGVAEGPLVGGNLSVLTRLIGTPYLPHFRGAVLLLEDAREHPYRLDRMWTHLQLSGVLSSLAGIVLGEFFDCEDKTKSYSSGEILGEFAQTLGVPCAAGFAIGHGAVNYPVPLGTRVRLNATNKSLAFLEHFAP